MSKSIPYVGQDFEAFPAPMRVSKLTWGPDSTYDVKITSTGTYDLWTLKAGIDVFNVASQVTTASTDMVATIGDSDDVDGWFTDTDFAPLSSGAVFNDGGGAYAGGKNYPAAQTVTMTVTTANTAGAGVLRLKYANSGNDDY